MTSNTIHSSRVQAGSRHKALDDAQALVTGALLAAVGVSLFKEAGLLTGGTVGLALALSYATGWNLSLALLLCNAPFYALACLRMGFEFTAKTLVAVAMTALFLQVMPDLLAFSHVSRLGAAAIGGLLAGIGILVLFRHRASLGGFNVVAVYCQERLGWSAGKVQFALDALVLAGGALATGASLATLAGSVLAGVLLNLVLMVNHRPGRYVGSP